MVYHIRSDMNTRRGNGGKGTKQVKWFFGIYCRIVYWGILDLFGKRPAKGSAQKLYDLVSELMNRRQEHVRFLNYGYHDPSLSLKQLLPHYDAGEESCSARLYAAVITAPYFAALRGKKVVEVGCGRGGGIAMIHSQLGVAEAIGLDLSPTAVANCRKWFHEQSGLTFVEGDASQLPFADSSVDVLINVESAHGYPDPFGFFAEVERVLVPGGLFFFTDFMPPLKVRQMEEFCASHHLNILDQCEITANVLDGIRHDQPRKMERLHAEKIGGAVKRMLEEFMGREGTFMYRRFSEKSLIYVRYVLIRGEAVLGQAGAPS